MSKGKLIVLEGLDGSGKATQAKLLAGTFKGAGLFCAGGHLPGLWERLQRPCKKCIWPGSSASTRTM